MARASIVTELHYEMKDEVGLLGRTVSTFGVHDVYIEHLSAYSVDGEGYLQVITRDNEKAKKAMESLSTKIEEREVLLVEFENKTGTLAEVAKILGNHSIQIDYVYGTSSDGFKIIGIFSTSDNKKAAEMINEETGRAS